MLLVITTVTTIDTRTGESKSRSDYRVEGSGAIVGLEAALQAGLAELAQGGADTGRQSGVVATTVPGAAPYDAKLAGTTVHKARHLAGLLRLPDDQLEQALATRPPGRVLEVLEWIKARRSQGPVKNIAGLFWAVVSKD